MLNSARPQAKLVYYDRTDTGAPMFIPSDMTEGAKLDL